jgi:hypothetical protein
MQMKLLSTFVLLISGICCLGSVRFGGFSSAVEPGRQTSATVEVTWDEAAQHLLSKREMIRAPLGYQHNEFYLHVDVKIVVDANGNVVSAKAINGPDDLYEKATDLARAMKFRPFMRDGNPVSVSFTDNIYVLPAEILPTTHIAFPDIHDWKKLRIALRRTQCYGTCPDYSVEIQGDGSVIYTGNLHVAVKGMQRSQISMDDLRHLLDLFRHADFYSLRDNYRHSVTDNPTYITSISIDGHTKTVTDYVGIWVGMPEAVENIEDEIDRVTDTAKWIKGKEQVPH